MYSFLQNHKLLICILFMFLFLSIGSMLRESLTFDEIVYIQAGKQALLSHTFDLDPYNPPFAREINMLPYVLTGEINNSEQYIMQHSFLGRLMSVFVGLLLLCTVYFFVKNNFRNHEANLAVLLLALEPNVLGNSHYITIDIFITFLFFVSFALLISLDKKYSIKKLMLLSIVIGLGCATKISFIPYFLVSNIVFIYLFKREKIFIKIVEKGNSIFFAITIVFLTIWAAYFFSSGIVIKKSADTGRFSGKVITTAKKYNLSIVSNSVLFFTRQPIPLGDYVATLKNNVLRSTEKSQCFFFGKFSDCQWYFMSVNLFLKTPLPLWIFFGVSLIFVLNERKKEKRTFFILIPIGSVLFVAMFLRMAPWVRYVIPLTPWLVIISALSLPFWLKTKMRKVLFTVLVCVYILGTILSYPHFVSYANELVFGQKHTIFIDSNMDWGQSLPDVQTFVKQNRYHTIIFSYFGRDNGDWYTLQSDTPYGSYKNNEICEFHKILNSSGYGSVTLISLSNWYYCGYNNDSKYSKEKIKRAIGDSIFVF